MFTRIFAGAVACVGFAGIGYNRPLKLETPLLSALRGGLGLLALVLGIVFAVMLPIDAAIAQDVSSIASSAVSSVDPSVVTVTVADHVNPVLDFVGALFGSVVAMAGILAVLVKFLPSWAQPWLSPAAQALLAPYLSKAVLWAIQEVEGFDKDKVIDVNVGSQAAASALRFLLDEAPAFIIKLCGGPDAIAKSIVAFFGHFGIVLGPDVSPAQVAADAAKSV